MGARLGAARSDLTGTVATLASLYPDPQGLLDERFKPPFQKGQPLADKILLMAFIAGFCGWMAFILLDVFRWHLLDKPNPLVSSLGLALAAAGWWIITLALKANPFAAPVVRHQAERRHRVVDTGVYSVVRHPMYAGIIPFLVGLALWLESYAAAWLAILAIGLLAWRIRIEEGLLRRELPGYEDYRQRVRYRLIPFVW